MSTLNRIFGASLLALIVTIPSLVAHADGESLADRQYWQKETDAMQSTVDGANTSCGTKITFDWGDKVKLRTESAKPDKFGNAGSPHGTCSQLFTTLASMCQGSADVKATVQKKVKSVTCNFGEPRSLSFKAGTFTINTNEHENNFDKWAQAQIGKLL